MATNKQPIAWHQRCIKNQSQTLQRRKEQLADLQREVDRLIKETAFYQVQICTAQQAGLDGFDPERYLLKQRTGFFAAFDEGTIQTKEVGK